MINKISKIIDKNISNQITIINSDIIDYSINEDENIFYIIVLEPNGFILISYDNLIRPVLAYSFENNFRFDNIPTNINYIFRGYFNIIF